jgi:hypothetical protein
MEHLGNQIEEGQFNGTYMRMLASNGYLKGLVKKILENGNCEKLERFVKKIEMERKLKK